MPNRTIYLPTHLDEVSRRLGLNLSQLTQQAIEARMVEQSEEALEAQVEAASDRIAALGLHWPENWLRDSREEAGER